MLHIVTLDSGNTVEKTKEFDFQHGLSFYIECNELKILFDSGADDTFIKNSEKLGCDLSSLNFVILSHRHYDHSEGYISLLEQGLAPKQLFVGTGFFEKKYEKVGVKYRRTDSVFEREDLKEKHIWATEISGKTKINEHIYLLSNFAHPSNYEKLPENQYILEKEGFVPDDFSDEIVLVFITDKGLVVLTGSSHQGIINILDTVKDNFIEPIYAVIGGFKVDIKSKEALKYTISKFIGYETKLIGCCREEANMNDFKLKDIVITPVAVGDEFFIE